MEKSLESKFETLIQQLKTRQYDYQSAAFRDKTQLATPSLVQLAEAIKTAGKSLSHQREELFFAYQTLETGYQRYWEFFNFAPDGYLVTSTDGIIQEANQTILSMLSAAPTDLLGKSITALISDIKQDDFGIQLNWFAGSQQLEVYFQPRDRTPFYASLSIAPQYNTQNRTVGLLWLVHDITERKKMEETLRNNRAELRMILEKTPCILLTTDKEFKITSISGTGINVFRSSPEEIIGRSFSEIFIKLYPDHLKIMQNALTGVPQTAEFEWKDSVFHYTLEALRDINGEIIGIIGAAFDITQRKKAERVLKKSEQFNASLLQHSPNPILVMNSDTTISYVNPAFEKLTGFSSSMVVGLEAPYPWWIEEECSEKACESFRKTLNKSKDKQETLFRKKNGEHFWVESSMISIGNEYEPGYYLQTWVDITESRSLRENLEFYMMQITRVQEEERKRIAQELHEETLQSLAALCLATESIIKSRQQGSRHVQQDLKGLRDKINKVIEEVRRFSYGLRPGVLDYLGLTAALETLTDELNGKGIKANLIIYGVERPLPPDMEITLFRIVQEGLSNVRKYSLSSKVNVTVKYSDNWIKVTINDNGRGFSLPERLSELANQGKLGLIGMEERTRLYGGSFFIQTQPRRGTRITIKLPVPPASK